MDSKIGGSINLFLRFDLDLLYVRDVHHCTLSEVTVALAV